MPEARENAGGVGALWGTGTSRQGLSFVLRACGGGEPAACSPNPGIRGGLCMSCRLWAMLPVGTLGGSQAVASLVLGSGPGTRACDVMCSSP